MSAAVLGRAGRLRVRSRLWHRLLILAMGIGLLTIPAQTQALLPPRVYEKDLKQEYLMARAILDDVDPYLPMPLLAERYLPEASVAPHSVPHPPPVAALSVPLGLAPFPVASAIWLGTELLLLVMLVALIATHAGQGRPPLMLAAVTGALLAWPPVLLELRYGQLNLLMAVLLVASWVAYRRRWNRRAGVLLGLAASIKLIPVVIIGYFLLRRQWLVAGWAVLATTLVCAASLVVIGADGARSYLTAGLPAGTYWRADPGNYSLVGAVVRTFAGNARLAPLVDLSAIALPLAGIAALGVLGLTARQILRIDDPDREFGIVLCTMLLVSPVTWQYYFVVLLWPLWIVAVQLYSSEWPTGLTIVAFAATLLVTIPAGLMVGLIPWEEPRTPGISGAILLALPLGPLLLSVLLSVAPSHTPISLPAPRRTRTPVGAGGC